MMRSGDTCRCRFRFSVLRLLLAGAVVAGCGYGGDPESGRAAMPGAAPATAATDALTASMDPRDIPVRTWVPRPLAEGLAGPIPNPDGAKHSRVIFDSKRGRMVVAGGDVKHPRIGNGNGNPTVWAIDLAKGNTWELLHDWCAGPGELMPGTPDTVGWAYASKHDQGVMLPGFYFITQGNRWCPEAREVTDAVLYDFKSNTWKPVPFPPPPGGWGGDIGASFATYDPQTDSIYRFRNEGIVEIFAMSGSTRAASTGPLDTAGNRDQPAIDVQGRTIYRVGRQPRSLVRYDIGSGSVSGIPLPRQWTAPPNDTETYLAFDPGNRVLLLPNVENFGGRLLGLGIYHVDTGRWEWEPVPSVNGLLVRGNLFGFDAKNNVFFLGAGHRAGGALPPVSVFWLYRYK